MRPYLFFSVLLLLTVYTGFKIHPLLRSRIWITVAVTFVLALTAWSWLFIYRKQGSVLETAWYPPLMWTGSIVLGFLGSFLIFSLIIDALHFVFFATEKFLSNPLAQQTNADRRQFIFRSASVGALASSAAISAIGFHTARQSLQLKKINIPIKDLPTTLTNLRVIQISDLHIGLTIDESYVRRVVDEAMQANPDIIVITGDLVDGSPTELENHCQPLRDLKARLGVYFITGNHEYYSGVEGWLKTTENLGFINLINENRVIIEHDAKILLAGVTDTSGGQFIPEHISDPKKAAQTNEICDLRILLAHRPESCFESESQGFHLQLSGHTHAGQFFPFNLFMFVHKYYKGLNRHGNMWVYVNQGTGYWGTPNRFALPAEITLIEFSREA